MDATTDRDRSPRVIRSMRIPAALDEALRQYAVRNKQSVNAIVEACLTKFIEFDQYLDVLDYGSVRKIFLVKGLEYLSENEIRELARWSAMELGAETLKFYDAYPKVDAVMHIYENVISKYGRLYNFRHETDGKNHTIIISHRMGKNWSIFFEENLKTIFSRLGIDLDTETSANLVRGRFVEKPTTSTRG